MGDSLDPKRIVKVVSHPTRRAVVVALGDGPLPWKKLAEMAGEKTGSLYHHLDVMEDIVVKDKEGRYALTSLGQSIYEYIKVDPMPNADRMAEIIKGSEGGNALGFFAPRIVITRISSDWRASAAVIAASLVLSASLLTIFGEQVWLFTVWPSESSLTSAASVPISFLFLAATSIVAVRVFFKSSTGLGPVLVTSALSMLPLVVLGVALRFSPVSLPILTALLILLQLWLAGFVSAGISVASGLRIERAFLVSLIPVYASVIVILFFQNGGL